jgi:hypothetical protein
MTVQLGLDGGSGQAGGGGRTGHRRFDTLLGKIGAAWAAFGAASDGLTDEQLLVPGVIGAWSVRDLIAHVTWWDEEAITHLPLIMEGGTPPRYSVTYGGIDAFNALMTERKAALSLDEVRRESVETHGRLVSYLLGLPPDAVMGNERFKRRLRLDTYGHYPIHTADILAWRERRGWSGQAGFQGGLAGELARENPGKGCNG